MSSEIAIKEILCQIPNVPNAIVPAGNSDEQNEVIQTFGKEPKLFDGAVPHWELAKKYNLIDLLSTIFGSFDDNKRVPRSEFDNLPPELIMGPMKYPRSSMDNLFVLSDNLYKDLKAILSFKLNFSSEDNISSILDALLGSAHSPLI